MSLHTDHRALAAVSIFGFLALSALVSIIPATSLLEVERLDAAESTLDERLGRQLYLREGCGFCHTQFVRDLPMDRVYGRGSIAEDYVGETPPLLGTQRTGPDLADVGRRQPSRTWHLLHLYNPRAVVPQSVMPGYPWYFEIKDAAESGDEVVPVPEPYAPTRGVVVAKKEALALTDYILSLKQMELPK